jgi:hypothetical protein
VKVRNADLGASTRLTRRHGLRVPCFLSAFLPLILCASGALQAQASGSGPPATAAATASTASTGSAASATAAAATATATSPRLNVVPPVQTDNLEESLRELHESLRRMKSDVDDILHEVTRTQEVFSNGAPVSGTTAITNSPEFNVYGGMTELDAVTHSVYMKPRPHWLDNSMAQLNDVQPTVVAETKMISKILNSPECKSDVRAQGFVLGDISNNLAKDLADLQAVLHEQPLVNAKITVMAKKVNGTIQGMYDVAARLWKEAPRDMKAK